MSAIQKIYFHTVAIIAFTMWLRIDEALSMKVEHITKMEDDLGNPFFRIRVPFRKTTQLDYVGRPYDLYSTPNEPETSPYEALESWLEFHERAIGHQLRPEYLLFPKLGNNNKISIGVQMPQPNYNTLLGIVSTGANLIGDRSGSYTLHCFRRGGAQHRFIRMKGNRWSLTAVRWWGGWTKGENMNTIVNYLLDEIQGKYEWNATPLDFFRHGGFFS
jgi:hypothetical protein